MKTPLYVIILLCLFSCNSTKTIKQSPSVMEGKEPKYSDTSQKCISISAAKMDVLYAGVDNIIEIRTDSIDLLDLKVLIVGSENATITHFHSSFYKVKVDNSSKKVLTINVSGEGLNISKKFRVKNIPDPIPKLSTFRGGLISKDEFTNQAGIFPILVDFDFDARCHIISFNILRISKEQDDETIINTGGKFTSDAKLVLSKASLGDRYVFENIKCQCPGDSNDRKIGAMVFTIK